MALGPSKVVRVLASVRIPSGHGPDVDYEIVQALVRVEPEGSAPQEAVLLRLVSADVPQSDRPAEILLQDLPAVQAQWTRFVQDVLWRHGQAPAPAAPAAPPVPGVSASGGRYGHATGEVPVIPMKKEKRISGAPAAAPHGFEEAAFDPPKKPAVPEECFVIGFNLSAPPTADAILRAIQDRPKHLVVVASMTVAPKVKEYLSDLKSGKALEEPGDFKQVVIRRAGISGPAVKKFRAQVAGGLAEVVGSMNSVLWIMPA